MATNSLSNDAQECYITKNKPPEGYDSTLAYDGVPNLNLLNRFAEVENKSKRVASRDIIVVTFQSYVPNELFLTGGGTS